MSNRPHLRSRDRPLVWLHGEVKTPPFTAKARLEAGMLLRLLQQGERLGMPWSRPMPVIGPGCHELRVNDRDTTWRIFHFLDEDAVVILDVLPKTTTRTPRHVIETCQARLRRYHASFDPGRR